MDPRLELILRNGCSIEIISTPNGQNRLEVEVLAPMQVFDQAKAISVVVTPRTWTARSILQGANGLVPIPEVRGIVALEVVPSRETEEGGMHTGERLHQVLSHPVRTILVWRWKQRDEVEV